MPVETTVTQSGPFIPNGAARRFPFAFVAASASEILVKQNGLTVSRALYSVELTDAGTGAVVFATPPQAGTGSIYIFSAPNFTSGIDIGRNEAFDPEVVTKGFDRAAIRDLVLRDASFRAVRAPAGEVPFTELPPAAVRANKHLAFDANGAPVLSSGTGADIGLREDIGKASAPSLIGAPGGTLARRLSVRRFLTDEEGNPAVAGLAMLQAHDAAQTISNYTLHLGPGVTSLSSPFVTTRQSVFIKGDGAKITFLSYTPANGDGIVLDGSGTPGGTFRFEVRDLGIQQNGVTGGGAAIRIENVANGEITNIVSAGQTGLASTTVTEDNPAGVPGKRIPESAMVGNQQSVVLSIRGRQLNTIRSVQFTSGKPVVLKPPVAFPFLDFTRFVDNELTCSSRDGACIDLETGLFFTQFTLDNMALVCGKYGIRWDGGTTGFASMGFNIRSFRTEQGLDQSGWSFWLDGNQGSLLNASFIGGALDSRRSGIYARKVKHISVISCLFAMARAEAKADQQVGDQLYAVDVDVPPGGSFIALGCDFQVGALARIANARRVLGGVPFGTGQPLGPIEIWRSFPRPIRNVATNVIDFGACLPDYRGDLWALDLELTETELPAALSTTVILPQSFCTNAVMRGMVELTARRLGTPSFQRLRYIADANPATALTVIETSATDFSATPVSGTGYPVATGQRLNFVVNTPATAWRLLLSFRG